MYTNGVQWYPSGQCTPVEYSVHEWPTVYTNGEKSTPVENNLQCTPVESVHKKSFDLDISTYNRKVS